MPVLPSKISRLTVRLLFAAGLTVSALAAERNAWPFWVGQEDNAGRIVAQQVLGPLYFERTAPDGTQLQVLRPLWLRIENPPATTNHFLYPFFTWQTDPENTSFTFFQLINFLRYSPAAGGSTQRFDIWPLYFSRDTGDPATSYRALLPFGGTIKNRFGKDRLDFVLWPLYVHSEKNGMETTSTPWPFIRTVKGAGHHGFEFWPLFGSRGREGDYRSQFALWPLLYRQEKNLSAPEPDVKVGALPFYARETGPGYRSETYVWPFFGYTHRITPERYDETRYFWPFVVRGRGDVRHIDRFAPFYSHSVIKGHDKTWYLWPLFREDRWEDDKLAHRKDAVLFFLYNSTEQRSRTNSAAAPAYKRHYWPLLSVWDNGAGRRQAQFLSPLEVFFPNNEPIRQLYSPLFALYRFDQRAPGDTRHSILWNLVSWKKSPAEREFHLGPLGWRRDAGDTGGRFFFFASRPSSVNPPTGAVSP